MLKNIFLKTMTNLLHHYSTSLLFTTCRLTSSLPYFVVYYYPALSRFRMFIGFILK